MKTTTYQIYGRKSYETPLTQQNNLDLAEGEDLNTAVLDHAADRDWIELIAIPVEKMIWVIQKGKRV
ncbi:MAG: hypothetical protein AAF490_21620 [Chloroflexota bacterium]